MAQAKKRQDDRYVAKVMVDGKAKYVYGKTIKERDEKVRELKRKLDKGLDISAERDTFGYWREKWLRVKKSEASSAWYNACKIYSDKLESLDHIPIHQIKAIDLQDILLDMVSAVSTSTGKPYSQKTLKTIKDTAAGIMDMAFDNRVVDYNPFSRVKVPKAQKETEHRQSLTKEQQKWIEDTPHRAQTAAMIMMHAGLRRGELLALLWSDIDIDNKTISITKSVAMEGNKPVVKQGGKTKAATRVVYIPDKLADYLRTVPKTTPLVCPAKNGALMSSTSWKTMWDSYIYDLNIKYGDFSSCLKWLKKHTADERPNKCHPEKLPILIPQFTAHWLRHTFVTNMYQAGVDVMTAQQQAGHSDIKVTMGIYTHLDAEYKKVNMSKLNDYLSGDNEKAENSEVVN